MISSLPVPIDGSNCSVGKPVVGQTKRQKLEHGAPEGTFVYGFVNGSVKCNEKLAELMDELRPLLRKLNIYHFCAFFSFKVMLLRMLTSE